MDCALRRANPPRRSERVWYTNAGKGNMSPATPEGGPEDGHELVTGPSEAPHASQHAPRCRKVQTLRRNHAYQAMSNSGPNLAQIGSNAVEITQLELNPDQI